MHHLLHSSENWILSNPGGNATTTTAPSRGQTNTPPTAVTTGVIAAGDGVIAFGEGGAESDPHLLIIPVGTGANDDTFSINVYGWRKTKIGPQTGVVGLQEVWVPVQLASYNVTLGASSVSLTTEVLGNVTTTFFADSASISLAPSLVAGGPYPVSLDWLTINPANDNNAMIKQPSFGFRFLEITFAMGSTSISASGANALVCRG